MNMIAHRNNAAVTVFTLSRDRGLAKTSPQAEINYILGYPTYPIPLSPYLSHPLVHALYVDLGGCGAAAEGHRAIFGASGNFQAISKRFRSDFEAI